MMEKIEEYNNEALSELVASFNSRSMITEGVLPVIMDENPELITSPLVECATELKIVSDYFNSDFGECSDTNIKKIVAAAAVVAKHAGVLPIPTEYQSPETIAATIDEGLNQIKVAYQTAQGVIESDEALDKLVDTAAARTVTAIDNMIPEVGKIADAVVEEYTPQLMDLACATLETTFPQIAPAVPIIKVFTPYITEAARVVVAKGITAVSKVAKSTVHAVVPTVKSAIKSIRNFLLDNII